jgi:hypothetical protein
VTCAWLSSLAILAALVIQADAPREYVDPQGRFRFAYPSSFGTPSRGTNDGFGDRVAAVRFSEFSTAAIGGEAALTRGFPVIDLQAVGGLYDAIGLEVFPDPLRLRIVQALPRLTVANFCNELAREQHLDPTAIPGLTPQAQSAITAADRMRNVQPRVVHCEAEGDIITFDKDVSFQAGGPRQHVYGAVRFVGPPYSTFQIVRAGPAPARAVLNEMMAVVRSWRPS